MKEEHFIQLARLIDVTTTWCHTTFKIFTNQSLLCINITHVKLQTRICLLRVALLSQVTACSEKGQFILFNSLLGHLKNAVSLPTFKEPTPPSYNKPNNISLGYPPSTKLYINVNQIYIYFMSLCIIINNL